jgi:hypothetical protein
MMGGQSMVPAEALMRLRAIAGLKTDGATGSYCLSGRARSGSNEADSVHGYACALLDRFPGFDVVLEPG